MLYLDDKNYYFDSSVLNSMVYDLKETDQHILNMPIEDVDNGKS